MSSEPSLYARLLIGTDHEITLCQAASLPTSFVQVKNAAGLGSEVGVARKNPAAVLPGSNSIFTEPTPDGGVADRCDKPRLTDMFRYLCGAPSRQRHSHSGRQLARDGLNFDDQLWGEKPGVGPGEASPRARSGVARRTSYATCLRLRAEHRTVAQFRRWKGLRQQAKSSWHAPLNNTATYNFELSVVILLAQIWSIVLWMGFFWAFLVPLLAHRMQQSDQKCESNTLVYL